MMMMMMMMKWSRYEHPHQGRRKDNAWAVGFHVIAKHDIASEAQRKKRCRCRKRRLRSQAVQGADWRRVLTYDVNTCLGGIHVHSDHSRARVVVVKGAREGVTSAPSHFASRLQEKQLQLEKKYDMEKDKIHNIYKPYV